MKKGIDLEQMGLVGAQEEDLPAVKPMSDEEAAIELMESINRTLMAQKVEIRVLQNRLATMETMVSYLLEKDPDIKSKMAAIAAEAEKAKNGKENG